jgi:hypothetical protein
MAEQAKIIEDITLAAAADSTILYYKPAGYLVINESFQVDVTKFPNRIHRFFARLLLGWRYERCE